MKPNKTESKEPTDQALDRAVAAAVGAERKRCVQVVKSWSMSPEWAQAVDDIVDGITDPKTPMDLLMERLTDLEDEETDIRGRRSDLEKSFASLGQDLYHELQALGMPTPPVRQLNRGIAYAEVTRFMLEDPDVDPKDIAWKLDPKQQFGEWCPVLRSKAKKGS